MGDILSREDGFGSDSKNARYKTPKFSLGSLLGIGDDKPKLDDIEGTEIVQSMDKKDQINLVPYKTIIESELKKIDNLDFIPFRFKDVTNNKYLVFRAILSGITDTVTPEYTSERYVGRPDKAYVYQGTDREISFTFDIYPKSKDELIILWDKLNYLVGMCYPSYARNNSMGLGMVAPFCELTIGDMFKNAPGYFESVNVTIPESTSWEIVEGAQFPHMCDISCTFQYIGRELPATTSINYDGLKPGITGQNSVIRDVIPIGEFT